MHTGNGPRPETDGAHVHFAAVTPDFTRLAVADLGNDTLTTYTISDAGQLGDPVVFHAEPGFGPRHIAFKLKHPVAYLLGELSRLDCILRVDAATGSFELIESLPKFPEDYTELNGAAEFRSSSDTRYCYVYNRGLHSLTVFADCPDGRHLTTLTTNCTAGDFPRDLHFDHSERVVLAVNTNK